MRIPKLLKILAISLGILLSLLLLFVTAFIYNPTEGDLPDMRDVVPRNVDFFLRKTDLREDFGQFPEPAFWEELSQTTAWRRIQNGPLVKDLKKGKAIENAIQELRNVAEQTAGSSSGMLDLLDDVIGEEVVLAGTFKPPTFEQSQFIAFTRVSWLVRFAWGLLGWGMVREEMANAGIDIAQGEGETFSLVTGGKNYFLGRHLDCVMITNDQGLLDEAMALASEGGDSFGASASYRDGIEGRLRDWAEIYPDVPTNALEMYVRPDQLFNLTKWDDGWPNPRAEEDMNERVLASFLNLASWRFMSGSLLFQDQPQSLTALARVDLNRNKHTGFQSEFFQAESAEYERWLKPFLAMVPEGVGDRGACAAAALRMDAADFLVEMYEALDDPSLIDEPLRKTGKYTGARDLIDKLRAVLLHRTGFVFMKARDLQVPVFDPSPAPHFAWVFWIRRESRGVIEELRDYLTTHSETIGFTKVTDLPVPGLADPCREFQSPHIPGTGEITLLIYGDFFVLSNSSFLTQDMIYARLNSRSLLQTNNWQIFENELPSHINGFVYIDGQRMANVFGDYVRSYSDGGEIMDASWAAANRKRVARQVFEQKYKRYGSQGRIPGGEVAEQFDADVDAALETEWTKARSTITLADREHYEQLRVMSEMIDGAYLQVELDPQFIHLTSGILFDY